MRRALLLSAALAAATTIAACSSDDPGSAAPASPDRVIVQMSDNSYTPSSFDVKKGETVTFEFVNDGQATHEAFIGDREAQDDHAADMANGEDHSMHMGAGVVVKVEPGESETITRTFDTAGQVLIGCHQPGHWQSGMKATVNVD